MQLRRGWRGRRARDSRALRRRRRRGPSTAPSARRRVLPRRRARRLGIPSRARRRVLRATPDGHRGSGTTASRPRPAGPAAQPDRDGPDWPSGSRRRWTGGQQVGVRRREQQNHRSQRRTPQEPGRLGTGRDWDGARDVRSGRAVDRARIACLGWIRARGCSRCTKPPTACSLGSGCPGGIVSAAQLGALADVAAEFGDGGLELTSRGNVQIRGIDGATAECAAQRLSAARAAAVRHA